MTSDDYNLKHGLFDDLAYEYPIIARNEQWKILEDFINKDSKGSRTFLIVGDYGCGKTLFLQNVKNKFRDGEFANSEKSLVISMRVIEGEPESKIGLSFVTRAFQKIGYGKITQIAKKVSSLDERLFDSNFQKIIQALQNQEREAYDWLCGVALTEKTRRIFGIQKNLSTSNEALSVFFNFLKLCKQAEIENVYLLIDEFEYVVTSYSQKQVDALLYLFKDIYDKYGEEQDTMAKTIFIIAMTPGCWDFLLNMEDRRTGGGGAIPWKERVNPNINQIQLLRFNENETEDLLIQRIKMNRIKHSDKLPHDTWPFVRPEFFSIIYEKGEGIPRKCLKYCDHVFDCGIEDNVDEFDGEYTKKILDKI
ncbi:MAG: hypothetical protein K5777_03330 [Nitrosopumilus sp.]|nr:hypothetical protein [Nitrosopumilus sp.]